MGTLYSLPTVICYSYRSLDNGSQAPRSHKSSKPIAPESVVWLRDQVEGRTYKFYAAMVGFKGDWPYLRKSYHLNAGFTSARKCHLCPSEAAFQIGDAF